MCMCGQYIPAVQRICQEPTSRESRSGYETPARREQLETRSPSKLEMTATPLAKLHIGARKARGVECQRRLSFALPREDQNIICAGRFYRQNSILHPIVRMLAP